VLSFEQIKELIELVNERGLDGLEIERSGFRLKIDGHRAANSAAPVAHVAPTVVTPAAAPAPITAADLPAAPGAEAEAAAPEGGLPTDAHVVKSPIVGTFYSAPSPDSEAYVKIGDRVEKGQVLCIVEAMKLMNEIESDVDGVVLEIFPKNAQAVEYGEPLFAIQAS
jgi:acetyl-CoA carboxylase biotin carboxyl carrier protein